MERRGLREAERIRDLLDGALGARERVTMLWNANNIFGFERIPWSRLAKAATITTVPSSDAHKLLPASSIVSRIGSPAWRPLTSQ